jgi:hypothetical protein
MTNLVPGTKFVIKVKKGAWHLFLPFKDYWNICIESVIIQIN